MIFTPYSDETNVINMIRKYRNEDYAFNPYDLYND